MLAPNMRTRIMTRIAEMIADCDDAQYKSEDALPNDHSFTVGEYPSLLDFLVRGGDGKKPGGLKLFKDVIDANGSTMMGMWFLSQSHKILGEITTADTTAAREAIITQLTRARQIPMFFQGTTEDVLRCPKETMGWYPLVDGFRIPAVIPDALEKLLPEGNKEKMANLSDGDFWSWCMAVDNTTPGILEYHHPITAPDVYEALLGSKQDDTLISVDSLDFFHKVKGPDSTAFPIGTFYGTSPLHMQHFSSAVISNILAAIPLQEDIPAAYMTDIENTMDFIRDATCKAIDGDITWEEFAYDYYTVEGAPIMYVVRAHKRIQEIGREGYPTLLDAHTIQKIVDYINGLSQYTLQQPNLLNAHGATSYATLVVLFNAIMNLRASVDPNLFDQTMVEELMEMLLTRNTTAETVPGTGPYELADLGLISVWVDMASICFIVPTLIEAYALYVLIEDNK